MRSGRLAAISSSAPHSHDRPTSKRVPTTSWNGGGDASVPFAAAGIQSTRARIRRASGSKRWPVSVSATARVVRRRIWAPRLSSRRRMRSENAAGDRCTRTAAVRNRSVVATASKQRSESRSMPGPRTRGGTRSAGRSGSTLPSTGVHIPTDGTSIPCVADPRVMRSCSGLIAMEPLLGRCSIACEAVPESPASP